MTRAYPDRDGLLRMLDSRIWRGDCGGWHWAAKPCATCTALHGEQVAA